MTPQKDLDHSALLSAIGTSSSAQSGEAQTGEFTGNYIITYAEEASVSEIESMLSTTAGVRAMGAEMTTLATEQEESTAVILDRLSVAIVQSAPDAAAAVVSEAQNAKGPILAIEPERWLHVLDQEPSAEYLRGYRDGVLAAHEALTEGPESPRPRPAATPHGVDTDLCTWGLQVTGVMSSEATGAGVKVAVLDTGIDLRHPDFLGREIDSKSFVPDQGVQDLHGHGTHCAGTACGGPSRSGQRRYGCAPEADLLVGKVMNNMGSGKEGWILAGIQWALEQGAAVISMSLGGIASPSTAYEMAGRKALQNDCLIVAATGNDSRRHRGKIVPVNRPANSDSIMGVAAVDAQLAVADFSNGGVDYSRGQVAIAAPGVDVFSTWPLPRTYRIISGTSMATPHVAGIAALWMEHEGLLGRDLWARLIDSARRLQLSESDVGAGLVQAP